MHLEQQVLLAIHLQQMVAVEEPGVAAVLVGIVVLLLANLLEAVHQPNLLYCFAWVLLTP